MKTTIVIKYTLNYGTITITFKSRKFIKKGHTHPIENKISLERNEQNLKLGVKENKITCICQH